VPPGARPQKDVEVVRRFFDEFANRDPSLDESWLDASDFLHQEFEYREDPGWPGAGAYRGISAFREVVAAYSETFGQMRLEAEEILEADDRILVLIRWWARGASGAEAEMHQAGLFTVRDDRLASWQVVFDRQAALEAAGLRD
jgi:ketosteroid isomerase-like protein